MTILASFYHTGWWYLWVGRIEIIILDSMHPENICAETKFSGLRWVMLLQERPFAGQVGCISIQIGNFSK